MPRPTFIFSIFLMLIINIQMGSINYVNRLNN